jgi:two-component system, NarL family, response regulator DevR
MDSGNGSMGSPPLRVAIADEYPIFRAGLEAALEADAGMTVVVNAGNGTDLLEALESSGADVVLIEPWMRAGDGLPAVKDILEKHPGTVVIALSRVWDGQRVTHLRELGVHGYLDKRTEPRDLPSVVRHVMGGGMVAPVASGGSGRGMREALSARELEVLALVADGLSNREIGDRLFVTEQTAKFHLANIFRKLGVKNRTEAARTAMHKGLIG